MGVKKIGLVDLPNVCSSMSLDFSHISQTSNRESEELAVESAGDRLSDRRLSYTGRSNKANDLALDRSTQFSDGQEFEDTILDVC